MLQTYEEALAWIHGRLRLGIKPGLKRMEWMMERLGNPERGLKSIHIGGTNGKGSTLTFLRAILEASGRKVGAFTSPYIEQFNERISINGKPIADEDLLKLTNVIKPLSDELEKTELGGPTEFEVITAMSLYYFSEMEPVDIVLYEVGLGGRFDSTNIIHPALSIITSIGLDHTSILGETYEEIAFEKAGIIKEKTPILTAVKQPEALQVIEKKAKEKQAPLFLLGEDFAVVHHRSLENGEQFDLKVSAETILESLEISMFGQHQTENASLAVAAALQVEDISESHIRNGLKKAYWPGRFEIVSTKPFMILDGAHNEEGVKSLVATLKQRFASRDIQIIFAALSDKKLDSMIHLLDEVAAEMTFVDFDFPRAADAKNLYEISNSRKKSASHDWKKAIQDRMENWTEREVLVITGSLYFLSEVKRFLKE